MPLIFLDVETTDLGEKARIVQLAYKHSVTQNVTNELFRPPCEISCGSMAVHHITNEMVCEKPSFDGSRCKEDLIVLLPDNVLVAHNAAFDMGVLKSEGVNANRYVDTLQVAKHLVESEQYSLQFLRYFLKLNVAASAHDALGDVLVLEALFHKLQNLTREKHSLDDDASIVATMEQLTRMPVMEKFFRFGKYKGQLFAEVAQKDAGYLRWLLDSEMNKPEQERSPNLVLTLKTHLNIPQS